MPPLGGVMEINMTILWICNGPIPRAAECFNVANNPKEGWLVTVADELEKYNNANFYIAFVSTQIGEGVKYLQDGGITFIGINYADKNEYEKSEIIKNMIQDVDPNVIHIWGTESMHSYYVVKAAIKLGIIDRVVASIQGLLSMYAYHYMAGIPGNIQLVPTIRDIVRNDTLLHQQEQFLQRGNYEKSTIQMLKNVIGRTFWDKACVKLLNPNINYYFNNETLRKGFYENTWDIQKCVRHRIFASQAQYPIKGFHYLIEAVALLKNEYSDIKVVVAGANNSFKKGILDTAYGRYLKKLIREYNLQNNIEYKGMLGESEIIKEYLMSEIFVSPSVIENSPNSVGEAMLLGMPVISSNVGGVSDLLVHDQEGYLYQSDAPYLLAYYIKQLFENDKLKCEFGKNAKVHARKTHDKNINMTQLNNIYKAIG